MKTLTLKHPFQLSDSRSITELRFREYATAGDYLAFDVSGAHAQTIALIARLTGTDESLIERLHVTDYLAADKITSQLLAGDTDKPDAGAQTKKTQPAS